MRLKKLDAAIGSIDVCVKGFGGKARRKRLLGRSRRRWRMGSKWTLGRLVGGGGVDSPGSGLGSLAGCCECGDEPSASGATELVIMTAIQQRVDYVCNIPLLVFESIAVHIITESNHNFCFEDGCLVGCSALV
jgi:hypothetical protein